MKLASGVVHRDVYLIAIADTVQRNLPVQKTGLDSLGFGRRKGEGKQEGKQSQRPHPHHRASNHGRYTFPGKVHSVDVVYGALLRALASGELILRRSVTYNDRALNHIALREEPSQLAGIFMSTY